MASVELRVGQADLAGGHAADWTGTALNFPAFGSPRHRACGEIALRLWAARCFPARAKLAWSPRPSLSLKIRRLAGNSRLAAAAAVTSLGNPARLFAGHRRKSAKMKKLRIVSQFLALASFVLWGTAALSGTIVPLISDGGTFRVPVTINDELTLKFVIDSGAADVSVPADVVMTLARTGTITDTDFLGKQTYQLADGSTVPSAAVLNPNAEGRRRNFRKRCRQHCACGWWFAAWAELLKLFQYVGRSTTTDKP